MGRIYPIGMLLVLAALILASCASHVAKKETNKNYVLYPSPPDTARVQFLTSISSSENTTTRKSAFSRFIVGSDDPKAIKKPYGVTINSGKIYVCDPGVAGLEIIDLKSKSFRYFIPEGKGLLKLPLNCFVDQDESLYVADADRKQIVVFDRDGNFAGSFGEPEKNKPTDVFVYGDNIYVANLANHSIDVFQKSSFKFLHRFPEAEAGEVGFLYQPTNLYVYDDKVFVSDMGDFNVKVFSLEGKFIKSIGSQGTRVGQFARPKGIAVDHDSNIYTVDAGFENVQVFDYDGQLLMFFGGPYKGPGDLWLPAKVAIDYDNVDYFRKYADPGFDLKYIILVTSQYGPDKLNIYGALSPIP